MTVPEPFVGLLLHATTWCRLIEIADSREIRPNDGSLPSSYFKSYYCREIGAVSLLDCRAIRPPDGDATASDSDWIQVFSFKEPVTFLLAIDPHGIAQASLAVPDLDEELIGSVARPFMRPGEVCHVGPVPFSAVVGIYASLDRFYWQEITPFYRNDEAVLRVVNQLRRRKYEDQCRFVEGRDLVHPHIHLNPFLNRPLGIEELKA